MTKGPWTTRARRTGPVVVVVLLALSTPALAAVSIVRAELDGARLRLEGTALPSRTVTVDGVAMGSSDGSGAFRIARDPYTAPPDCTVDVGDGSATVAVVRLAGCTVLALPVPPPAVADTTAPSVPADVQASLFGTTITVSWSRSTDATGVAGYRLSRNGSLRATTTPIDASFTDSGLPAGTYTYTVVAFDAAGNSSGPSGSASATVAAPATTGLTLLTPAQLPDATVREAYLGYVVGDAGVKPYRFRVVAGRLPDGLRLVQPSLPSRVDARIVGTPTTVGGSSFTIELSDAAGRSVRKAFTLSVLAVSAPAS